jgi:hypothetical protein
MKRGFHRPAPTWRTSRACIAIFEASGDGEELSSYVDTHRMFARVGMMALCKQALSDGPTTTKELALHVIWS